MNRNKIRKVMFDLVGFVIYFDTDEQQRFMNRL